MSLQEERDRAEMLQREQQEQAESMVDRSEMAKAMEMKNKESLELKLELARAEEREAHVSQRIEMLEAEMNDLRQSEGVSRETVAMKEGELSALRTELSTSQRAVGGLQEKLANTQAELSDKVEAERKKALTIELELERVRQKAAEMQQQSRDLSQKVAEAHEAAEAAAKEQAALLTEQRVTMETKNERIAELRLARDRAEEEKDHFMKMAEEEQVELARLSGEIHELIDNVRETYEEHASRTTEEKVLSEAEAQRREHEILREHGRVSDELTEIVAAIEGEFDRHLESTSERQRELAAEGERLRAWEDTLATRHAELSEREEAVEVGEVDQDRMQRQQFMRVIDEEKNKEAELRKRVEREQTFEAMEDLLASPLPEEIGRGAVIAQPVLEPAMIPLAAEEAPAVAAEPEAGLPETEEEPMDDEEFQRALQEEFELLTELFGGMEEGGEAGGGE